MFKIGDKVKVVLGLVGEYREFESEIVDILDNGKWNGVWVNHPDLHGEDMLFINLDTPLNSVKLIEEDKVERVIVDELKDIHKELDRHLKWVDEDEEVQINVAIYDVYEDNEQSYEVEINVYINGEYDTAWATDVYYGNEKALKEAKKRAKTVLRTVKGWSFADNVAVGKKAYIYNNSAGSEQYI